MQIVSVGAGPASLYQALLMKQAFPDVAIRILERNPADATFGWGVVFSDETLGHFEQADPETYRAITEAFSWWSDIDTWIHDTCVRSTGHGFCGMSRHRLLEIFHDRCRDLGVELVFDTTVEDPARLAAEADLLIGGDGLHSVVRETWRDAFQPHIDGRHARFTWLGTTLPLDAFTFIFRENEHGLFQVHAYPFQPDRSTFIVECHEDVWRRAGLDEATEADTVAYMEALFADHLDGHRLLTNKSIWRSFPTVRCTAWHQGNVVLLGDAAHTAHFSIGSGTKLAMEDAIALVEAFRAHGTADVPRVLAAYEASRRLDVVKLQKAAQTSLEWFENAARYLPQDPITFTFNLMSRSKRITYDNLVRRDPDLVAQVTRRFAEDEGVPVETGTAIPAPAFVPFETRGLRLANRIVVSPMCQYRAEDGMPTDWHQVHLGSLATGGAGLVLTEMTNVSAAGRISPGCTGIYTDAQADAWARIVDFAHAQGTPMGLQMGHAGRKASCSVPWEGDAPLTSDAAWPTVGPTDTPFRPGWPAPRALDEADLEKIRADFVDATHRARRAGFDVLEVHLAHGYLLSSFLSPLVNTRTDAYGGNREGRARFPLRIVRAVREAWGDDRPLFVRISATDWLDEAGGQTLEDSVDLCHRLRDAGVDVVDVSTAGNVPESAPVYGRMYQVPFAERIRQEVGIPVMAVGGIQGVDHANTILAARRADLCAIARGHLLNPHLTLAASAAARETTVRWPAPYQAARPAPRQDPPGIAEILRRRAPRIRHGRGAGSGDGLRPD